MLTLKTIQILGWSINVGSTFKLFPFHWDERRCEVINLPNQTYKLHLVPSSLNFLVLTSHTVFVIVRLLTNFKAAAAFDLILHLSYIGMLLLPSMLLLNVLLHRNEAVAFINQSIHYLLGLQDKYVDPNLVGWDPKFLEDLLVTNKWNTYFTPILLLILTWRNPGSIFLISSTIPPEYHNFNVTIALGCYYFWLYWTVALVLTLHMNIVWNCIFPLSFLLKQLCHRKKKSCTVNDFRKPQRAASTYICMQILTNQMNICFQMAVMFSIGIVIGVSVFNTYMITKILHGFVRCVFIFYNFSSLVLFVTCLHKIALIYHDSNRVICSWKICRKRKSIIRIFWMSRQTLRLSVGSLHHIDTALIIRIVGIITISTGKLLIFL